MSRSKWKLFFIFIEDYAFIDRRVYHIILRWRFLHILKFPAEFFHLSIE